MNLRLGFFDIDGTLIHRGRREGKSLKTRSINHAMQTVFEIEGIDYISILGKRIYGMTDISIMKSALAEYKVEETCFYENIERLFAEIDRYFEAHLAAKEDNEYSRLPAISGFLERLRKKEVRLGLVTGNIKKHSDWKMKNAGFDNYFSTGAYGEDAENRWEIMSVAIERNSDIPLGSICHFGDSPSDLEAASRCGIRAVGICDRGGGTHSRIELEKTGYGLVIDSWEEIGLIERYLA